MTVLQLVARDRPEGLEELSVVPNPTERDPDSFATATFHPKRIGSQELITLAAGLCRQSYRAMDAVLTDRFFDPIRGEQVDELRTELLALINGGADIDAIEKFLAVELNGIYVESVRLLDPTKKGSISFRQEGVVIASPSVGPDALTRSVQIAVNWAEAS